VAVALVAGGVAVAVSSDDSHGTVRRVDLPSAPPGSTTPAAPLVATVPDEPINVLLVGSDERAGDDADAGEVSGRRSDTIAVARIDADGHDLRLLSIPRDLWVTFDDGTEGRINGAFNGPDGPAHLVQAIGRALGIPINRYLEIDFRGFQRLVDDLGGIDVDFPGPARDTVSGFATRTGGPVHLDGPSALLYVRSRHLETLTDGRWVDDPTGDLGRIRRQQDLLRRLVLRAQDRADGHPEVLDDLLRQLGDDVAVDRGFPATELLGLVRTFGDVDPASVPMDIVPTTIGREGSLSVLHLDAARADDVLEPFRG
jgi:LCP family protein required for cell wall assembly